MNRYFWGYLIETRLNLSEDLLNSLQLIFVFYIFKQLIHRAVKVFT
jgi:hypothetical protein